MIFDYVYHETLYLIYSTGSNFAFMDLMRRKVMTIKGQKIDLSKE